MSSYAITDIHGCTKSLRQLLEVVLPTNKHNIYYFLGDYVNKGPDSKGTLDYLMQFAQHHQCRFIRGNHDQLLLDIQQGLILDAYRAAQLQLTLQSFKITDILNIPIHYLDFISQMEWYISLPNFLLVHAGFNFEIEDIFADKVAMLSTKLMNYDIAKAHNKSIIRGHIPNSIINLKTEIAEHAAIIGLDTGCVYRHNKELATLTALNLDTLQLYFQPNIEGEYAIAKR